MAYCELTDILERIPEETLIQLTDDTGAGEVEASAVARAVADADAEIDGYLGTRYPVPLATVPALLRKTSVELAVYHLHARRAGAPDEWRKRYEDARRLLEGLAKGLVSLGLPASDDSQGAPASQATLARSQRRAFSRQSMRDF